MWCNYLQIKTVHWSARRMECTLRTKFRMLWQLTARRTFFGFGACRNQIFDVVVTIRTVHTGRMFFELRWFRQFLWKHWRLFGLFNRLKLRWMLSVRLGDTRCIREDWITWRAFQRRSWFWFLPSSSSSSVPSPIFFCNANWVCRSISRISSMVRPYHSSCQAHACRWARTIVFRNAVSWMNFSNFVCMPQYRNSTRHNLYAHISAIFFEVGCSLSLTSSQ